MKCWCFSPTTKPGNTERAKTDSTNLMKHFENTESSNEIQHFKIREILHVHLQIVGLEYSTIQYGILYYRAVVQYSKVQYGIVQHSTVQHHIIIIISSSSSIVIVQYSIVKLLQFYLQVFDVTLQMFLTIVKIALHPRSMSQPTPFTVSVVLTSYLLSQLQDYDIL